MNAILHNAGSGTAPGEAADDRWLDLDELADITIVVDGERVARSPHEWTADCPGEQMIEIRFRQSTSVSRLRVVSWEVG